MTPFAAGIIKRRSTPSAGLKRTQQEDKDDLWHGLGRLAVDGTLFSHARTLALAKYFAH